MHPVVLEVADCESASSSYVVRLMYLLLKLVMRRNHPGAIQYTINVFGDACATSLCRIKMAAGVPLSTCFSGLGPTYNKSSAQKALEFSIFIMFELFRFLLPETEAFI